MLEPEFLVLLMLVAGVAGFIDTISGGGGLLTVPALMWAGLPPLQALATNKLQAVFGSFGASLNYILKGELRLKPMVWVMGLSFCGSWLGSLSVQQFAQPQLQIILPLLLLGFGLYFLFSPRIRDEDGAGRIGLPMFGLMAGFGIGFYDGFFGPGAGTLFTLAYSALLGFGLRRAAVHARLLNFTSNLASLLVFAAGGHLLWSVGLPMALGQILGSWLGSQMVLRYGSGLIRPLLVLVSVLMAARLLWPGA